MVNCPNCGVALKKGEKFCSGCGAKIETYETSMTQQMPAYTSQPAKKANKGLIIGIIAIIAIVIAIFIVVVIIIGGGSIGDNSLVGTWEAQEEDYLYIFNADGTLELGMAGFGTMELGTWSTSENQLCIEFSMEGFGDYFPSEMPCIPYSISDDGNTMTWSYSGQQYIFTKK